MTTTLQISHVMPMLVATVTWPRTAAEAREWCRARNEESRRERERKDAEHRRELAEHAQLSRELQAELERRQRERGAAPKTAPDPHGTLAPLSTTEIYARRDAERRAPLFNVIDHYRQLNTRGGGS